MKVERIDHIHIAVKDLEAAAKFFSDTIGSRWFGPKQGRPGFQIAFDNLGLELQQPTTPDNPVAKHLEEHGQGVTWIGLKVPNLDEAVAELKAKGIRVEYWIDYTGLKVDLKAARTVDPEETYGVMFELVEYEDVPPAALGNWNKLGEVPRM